MGSESYNEGRQFTLVVGSDSLIGKALMAHLNRAGSRVLGTTRRYEQVDDIHLYLDLAKNVNDWQCPFPVKVAVVCAGVTNLDMCRHNPIASASTNVEGLSALVKNLVNSGAFVIYLSTNQVFDGTVPYRKTDDPLSPITEYGRQKAEAELRISAFADSVAIVRLTKVLGQNHMLFSAWAGAMQKGEAIQPFADMVIAPIPLSCVVSVIRLLADRRLSGIFHVSGERDISYAEAAFLGAELLGADSCLIQPVNASQSGHYTEVVPAHTTLNIDSLRFALGIEPPDVRWTVKMAYMKPSTLVGIDKMLFYTRF